MVDRLHFNLLVYVNLASFHGLLVFYILNSFLLVSGILTLISYVQPFFTSVYDTFGPCMSGTLSFFSR
jgi:hypothetical protein